VKFSEYVKTYIPKINKAIENFYDSKLEDVKNSFLQDYYNEIKEYFLSGGKRIRPLLCIATYNAFNKEKDEKIVFPSISVEFLHNASLIHDDIIDKDNFRRGKPSFHYRFRNYHKNYEIRKMDSIDYGNSIGLIGGDSVFIMGLEPLFYNEFNNVANLNAIRYYERGFSDIINGVLIEMDMVHQNKLTIEDYIEMISLKTGALLEKSILIGANYANIEDNTKSILSTYGINLGIIFQIIDDILGTFGDEKVTGKPTDGDIREGKKTSLLISAYNNLKNNDVTRLNQLIDKQDITDEEVFEVKELFQKADVINSSKKLANKYYQEAKTSLEKLKPLINNSELEFFEDLLNFVLNRKF